MSNAQVTPYVSVAVLTYNTERTLRQCLSAIFDQEYPKSLYEVFLVDGGSTDDTLNIAKDFPVKIYMAEGTTRPGARNICMEKAKGEILVQVDSDVILPKHWLAKAVKLFNDPSVAMISGPYHTPMEGLGFIGKVIYYVTSGWQAKKRGIAEE